MAVLPQNLARVVFRLIEPWRGIWLLFSMQVGCDLSVASTYCMHPDYRKLTRFDELRLFWMALADGLEQNHARGYRNVERLHRSRRGQRHDKVAPFARQVVKSFAFAA